MQAASDAIYPGSHLNTLCPGNNFSVRMILTITEEGTAQIHFCMVEQTVMFIVYVMRVFASMVPMLTVLYIIIL